MPKWGYSITGLDPVATAKASGRDIHASPKATREVCNAIRNMTLSNAKEFLDGVIALKKPVPYRRYSKKVPHRHGLEGWYAGRYPVKAAAAVLKVLNNLEMNAIEKGLDVEKLRVIHAAGQRARVIRGFVPRAMGRASPSYKRLSHIELVVEEQ